MFNYTFRQLFATFLIAALSLTSYLADANNSVKTSQLNDQMTIAPLAVNVFQHISYKQVNNYGMVPASGLILVDGKDAHIIDTPWTEADTKNLVAWIKEQGLIPKTSISTHFHDDRAGGIPYLNKLLIPTYASKLTNQLLESNNKQAATHHLLMNNNHENKQILANGNIEVFSPGPGHSPDNIVVWLPKHKLLFGGCFVKSLHSKTLGYTGDADLAQWPVSIKKLIDKYPLAKTVVPGHGKIGGVNLLTHTLTLALKANEDINSTKQENVN